MVEGPVVVSRENGGGYAMRGVVMLLLLVWVRLPAFADYVPTQIRWAGWRVASSENLYAGRVHTGYPLTYLLDGNPRTAWVFSGTGKCKDGWHSRYALALSPMVKPVVIDSVWLMNGYNKSRDAFLRNNRVVEVRLLVNAKKLKATALSDTMGWHRISVPRQEVRHLQLDFTRFKKGPDDDVCVSELAFYDRGRKIDMGMPKAVIFSPGSECGEGSNGYLMSHSGRVIARDGVGEGGMAVWSPNGRFVTSAEVVGGRHQLWVADGLKAQVIYRRKLPHAEVQGLQWRGNGRVEVTLQVAGRTRKETFGISKRG